MTDNEAQEKGAPVGKPPVTEAQIQAVIDRIRTGESVRQITKDPETRPCCERTFYDFIETHEEYTQKYIAARKTWADIAVDEINELADNAEADPAAIAKAALQIKTRTWTVARMNPKKYGDRQAIEHSGPDGGPVRYSNLSDDELKAEAARLFGATEAGASNMGTATPRMEE